MKGDRYEHTCKQGVWECVNEPKGRHGFVCNDDEKSTHEWGVGILVGSNSVVLDHMTISEMTGDGIRVNTGREFSEIDPNPEISYIKIYESTIDDVRRNGIAVISARNVYIYHNTISNVNGIDPQVGIDFETNYDTQGYNAKIVGNTIYGNNRHASIFVHKNVKSDFIIRYNSIGDQIVYRNDAEQNYKQISSNCKICDHENLICNHENDPENCLLYICDLNVTDQDS